MFKTSSILSTFLVICCCALTAFSQTETEKPKETTQPANSYRIRNGDKISVKFLYQSELNEPSIVVRPDGYVSLQLIEDIKVEGLTATEIKTRLEKLYNESLINPVISVNVVEFVPASVFIGGQVAKPGKYSLRDADTIVQTIFLAGGFTRDANRRMILYARSTGDKKWSVQQINALKLIDNSLSQQDLTLQDGDYIFVPDSKISKFNKALEGFQSFFPLLRIF